MADEYYTMETVRDQILQKGKVDRVIFPGVPSDWNYCPCVTVKNCEKRNVDHCTERIGISFYVPHNSVFVIEIIYIREKHHGFIKTNHMQLNKLIAKGIISKESLEKVMF
jgi:hypothetical protein